MHIGAELLDIQCERGISARTQTDSQVVAQQLIDALYLLCGRVVVRDALFDHGFVPLAVQEHTPRLLPVTSGSSGFLEVRFDGVRQIVVDNEPHIGFVDTHAERVGADDDARLRVFPCLLFGIALAGRQPRMVIIC